MDPEQTQRMSTATTLRRWAAHCETSWDGWRLAALAVDGYETDADAAAWADVFCVGGRPFRSPKVHSAGDAALALCFAAAACESGEDIWEPF